MLVKRDGVLGRLMMRLPLWVPVFIESDRRSGYMNVTIRGLS